MLHIKQVHIAIAFIIGLAYAADYCGAGSSAVCTNPPGTYHTSWIGNSFSGGDGGRKVVNGFGYWVQDGVATMAVSADGTVFAGVGWDEAGRCVGLYKNGQPNRVLVQANASPAKAWGWNTANSALGVDGANFYVGTTAKALLRFQWTPGDINSAKYVGQVPLPAAASDLSCGRNKIVIDYPDKIEIRSESDLQPIAAFPIAGARCVVLAQDSSLWGIVAGKVRHWDANGIDSGFNLPGIGTASALAWDNDGRLIVCDNGPAQQVLFFDVGGSPKLVRAFGVKGGLYAGTPGAVASQKLFALRGAGTDALGNLYVAMGFSGGPQGNCYIRAFSPKGDELWDIFATAFVDAFNFDPDSDGTVVYGRTTRWSLDLDRQKPGSEATLKAVTLDPLRFPADPRSTTCYAVYPRTIRGIHLLYASGQTGGGLSFFARSPASEIFHPAGGTRSASGWAWDVTTDGDIWNGDAPGKQIARFPLTNITPGGKPAYDWDQPQLWPWPSDFSKVTRTIYNKDTDSLYVFGYLTGQRSDSWGVVGFTGRRYDGWLAGKPTIRWTNTSLPASPNGMGAGEPLSAKDVALAGDYLFFGMVRGDTPAPQTHILSAIDGRYVGTFTPGPEVGSVGGWQDMVGSIHAIRRSNGEYLVLVEEDWRAKNLLFRWKP